MLCFFQWFVCPVSRKVGSVKRQVQSHVVRGEIKNCTPLWQEAHSQVKMYKTRQVRSTFWSWDLRCWKIARHCGEKHIFKSKCTKHVRFGPLFEVKMLKNCTPLWREAHVQVKMYKTRQARSTFEVEMLKNCTPLWREPHFQVKMLKNLGSQTTFWSSDVEKLHAVVARSTCSSQNVQNTAGSEHFLKLRFEMLKNCTPLWRDPSQSVKDLTVSEHFLKFECRKIPCRCGEKHICKSKCTKHLCFAALFDVQMSKN